MESQAVPITKPCAFCGRPTIKVIYMGFPGRLCEDHECSLLDGPASLLPIVETNTDDGPAFIFVAYEGHFLVALWYWLIGRWDS